MPVFSRVHAQFLLSMINTMTPAQRYERDLASGILLSDPAQAEALRHFQRVYDDLLEVRRSEQGAGLWQKLTARLTGTGKDRRAVKGLYLYGGVGRGKTWLMDVFYESLPFPDKMRTHFHRFMQRVHAELSGLKQQSNPLETVATKLAAEARVICFDEFFVSDIGDAMILGGLLEHLLAAGVTLVTTSNIEPDRLYENGLQRARFLPAIALINAHAEVVQMGGEMDYRLRSLQQAHIYYSPLGEKAETEMVRCFQRLVPEHAEVVCASGIEVLGRQIKAQRCADDVVWFDFEELCGGPRSAYDYIELAKVYHAILLSNVPQLAAERDDMARRFVSLVDELYDRNVKLIISAEVPLSELYTGTSLTFVFERTRSRLLEMQSKEYLGRQHRP